MMNGKSMKPKDILRMTAESMKPELDTFRDNLCRLTLKRIRGQGDPREAATEFGTISHRVGIFMGTVGSCVVLLDMLLQKDDEFVACVFRGQQMFVASRSQDSEERAIESLNHACQWFALAEQRANNLATEKGPFWQEADYCRKVLCHAYTICLLMKVIANESKAWRNSSMN